MIRRISKDNDLKDVVTAKGDNVLSNIYSITYYIAGSESNMISPEWELTNNLIEVVIPTTLLATLPNGILMRKASYRIADEDYPDGYYNIEFVDSLDIWLGDEASAGVDTPYLTKSALSSALTSYATQSWVTSQGYLTSHQSLSSYATQYWVNTVGFATQSWVLSQSYVSTSTLSGYATQSWVEAQGYLTSQTGTSALATQSWVEAKGYLTSHQNLSSYATQAWVAQQGYLTSHQDLTGYATQEWVASQSYLTSTSISAYATQEWVAQQGYLSSFSESDPTVPAWAKSASKPTYTASEVSALALSAVWTGTSAQWASLTSAQQALYTIALITE